MVPDRESAFAEFPISVTEAFDRLREPFYVVDADERLVWWNERVPEVTGYADETVARMTAPEFFAPGDRERVEAAIERLLDGDGPVRVQARVETADGEHVPFELTGHTVRDDDGQVCGFTGTGRDLTSVKRRERVLERQREELERLDGVNDVIRDVLRLLVRAESPTRVRELVCERLVAEESYRRVWFGRRSADGRVRPVTAAGAGDGRVSARETDDDADPVVAAADSGELRVDRDGVDGVLAAVPVTYEGVIYGVLVVVADLETAFDVRERQVLHELCDGVGHALGALRRREVLRSDSLVELEFAIRDDDHPLAELTERGGEVQFHRAVPIEGGRQLWYVSIEGTSTEAIDPETIASIDPAEAVRGVHEAGDATVVEVVVGTPNLASRLATHGAHVRSIAMRDGDTHLRVGVASGADPHTVVDAVDDVLPETHLCTQRTVARDDPSGAEVRATFDEALTDRQREVVEAAYYAGYFEQPRAVTGEEVADRLGISSVTFHEHLRTALAKLLRATLDE